MMLLAAAPRSSIVQLQISDNLPAKWRTPVISTTFCNVFKGGTQTDTDVEDLRQWLNSGGIQNLQVGKYNVSIRQEEGIHIGDRIYRVLDAEAIREVVRAVT
jgi:Effector-associated domain 10